MSSPQGRHTAPMNELARVVRRWMAERGIQNARQLARITGLPVSTCYNLIETGKPQRRQVNLPTLQALIRAAGPEWEPRIREAAAAPMRARQVAITNPLQALVVRRLVELNLSQRDAVRRSGDLFSQATIARIVDGQVGDVAERTLQGLALALDVPLSQVVEAFEQSRAGKSVGLPARALQLPPDKWRELETIIDNMLAEASGEAPEPPHVVNGE